jgi:hypothetical protein
MRYARGESTRIGEVNNDPRLWDVPKPPIYLLFGAKPQLGLSRFVIATIFSELTMVSTGSRLFPDSQDIW